MAKNVIVIGAGITGVSAAEWLRRDGHRVTLVDRVEPGAPEQTSYGNAGLLARCAVIPIAEPGLLTKAPKMLMNPDSPLFLRWRYLPRLLPWLLPFLRNTKPEKMESISKSLMSLTGDAVDQHLALAAGTEAEKYIKTGDYAFYYQNKKAFAKDAYGMQVRRDLGFSIKECDRAELLERDPELSARYNYAAVFDDHGWLTSPGDYVAALARHFTQGGGVFHKGEVSDIGDTSVTLATGETLQADKIVLAAGAWSGNLGKKLGQRPLLETERGYHLFLNGATYRPTHPFMVTDAKFVVTPMQGGIRCAGIVEFGGLSAPPSTAPVALLKRRVLQVYPNLKWDSQDIWMGHRPSTPDSLPHLGPLQTAPNVICAYGSQHIGLTIGPRLGRLAADMVAERRINTDITALSPERFS